MKTGEFKMWQLLEKPSIKKQFKRWLKLQEEDPFTGKTAILSQMAFNFSLEIILTILMNRA